MRTCKPFLGVAVVTGVLASLGLGHAQTLIVLNPIHDTYVNSDFPTSSFGDEDNLFVHAGSNTKRTYLQFDLGSIPVESVTSMSLRMSYAQGGISGTVIDVHHVAYDLWNESSLTWQTKPAYQATPLATATSELGKAEVVWSLPLQLLTTDSDGTLSLLLRLENEGLSDTASFFSKEATQPLARPSDLVLTVPEPTEALLAAGGLLSAWALYRRRAPR